ncbi:MAG TPA: GNAT family N-acetyltransferase [Thermoanaerobaculia bacterium]|nr:GNAT family N-acetyltransferase [Thermoanaerobaculia bacterium]
MEPLPPGVEVLRAPAGQEPVLANLLELYCHDFSEFFDLRLQPNGRFEYPGLSRYWQDENRFPFLVKVDGHPAGFAFVVKGSFIRDDPTVWDMAEFFVVRGCRKRGIGAAVAREVWRRFPGPWEVRVLERNLPALAFWGAVVGAFTGSQAEGTLVVRGERRWRMFSFVSPAMDGVE